MQRFYVNLTPELKDKIEQKAWLNKTTKAEITREALKVGLNLMQPPASSSAQVLLDFAHKAEKIPTQGKIPQNAIENMDYYTWGGNKRG